MLYQEKRPTTVGWLARRMLALVAGALSEIARSGEDRIQLDGMRGDQLEELGLRRTGDGEYRVME